MRPTFARMVPTVSGVPTRGFLPPLFCLSHFPVAWNCSTVFTVFLDGASLHLYWFLKKRWIVTVEFICKNHYTIWVFCSVVNGGAILNDVTAVSVAKYGKNTNVWRLRRYHLHRRLATGWTVRGSNLGGGEIFRTCPDRPWDPHSLLYNGYRVFPRGEERPERNTDSSPHSNDVVKKE